MKIEIYKQKGEWRWRIKARNGRILAVSSEGYKAKRHCERMAAKCTAMRERLVIVSEGSVK